MANKNGHWYTDKNGNHYFVEEGQTPQEGWEASKRRKMINGGKYQVSEDGNEYRDVEKDEYDKFEADDASFDDNIDDDFGFDEDAGPVDRYGHPIDIDNLDMYDDEDIYETDEKGFVTLPKKLRPEIQAMIDAQQQGDREQNAAMSEGQDDDFNKGQTVDAPEKGEGWKKTKMASGTLYEGPNGERYMDDGSAPEKVKIGAKEMTADEWKDWYHKLDDNNREMGKEFLLNHASEFDMSENEMKAFLDGSQTNEYNYKHPGHYNKDGSWKPSNHETKEWAPKYFGVYEKRNPDGIGYTEKEYRGDFPSLEEAKEFASKYEGNNELMIGEFENQGNGGYKNINNQKYEKPTPGQTSVDNLLSKSKNVVNFGKNAMPNGSSYLDENGNFISSKNGDMDHNAMNSEIGSDLYNEHKMIALNPGVYGSRVASIDVPKGKQLSDFELEGIKNFLENAQTQGKSGVDFGNGMYDFDYYGVNGIVYMLKKYLNR